MTPALYNALGLPSTATASDIAKSFRSASLRLHPDRNIGVPPEDLSDQFQTIAAAYAVLSDPDKRAAYDAKHGVNFHSRIAALQTAAKSVSESSGGALDADIDTDTSRKRDRPADSHNDDDDSDEEYDPAPSSSAPEHSTGVSVEVDAKLPSAASTNATTLADSITWSAVPVEERLVVNLTVTRTNAAQKWGIDCSVLLVKDVKGYKAPTLASGLRVTSCLVLKPLDAVANSSAAPTPSSGLPRSTTPSQHVVLEAVDGSHVQSVADLVKCTGTKLSVTLSISIANVHQVRLDVPVGHSRNEEGVAWLHFHSAFVINRMNFRIQSRQASDSGEGPTGTASALHTTPEGVLALLEGARLLGARLLHRYELHAQGHLPFAIFGRDQDVDAFIASASEAGDASLELLVCH